jgi:hypothetical protein
VTFRLESGFLSIWYSIQRLTFPRHLITTLQPYLLQMKADQHWRIILSSLSSIPTRRSRKLLVYIPFTGGLTRGVPCCNARISFSLKVKHAEI